MKRLPLFALATVAAFAADAPPTPQDWIVHIEFTAITLPEKVALPLLEDLGDEQKEQAAFAKIEAALAKGEATLEGKQLLLTVHEEKAVSETGVEMRYATEFENPNYPNLGSAKDVSSLPKDAQTVFFQPSGFETRPIGLRIEAWPKVSADGKWLSIQAEPQHTRFLKWDEFGGGITPTGTKFVIQQPRFAFAKDTLKLVVQSGSRALVGIHQVPDQPKTMELFFIRAWTTRKPPGSEAVGK